MKSSHSEQVTEIINDAQHGIVESAEKLLPLVYDDFRELAASYLRRERSGHTLQPTALVHEVYLKLVDQTRVDWRGRTHFFAVGAQIMRRILVDYARQREAVKRGGGRLRVSIEDQPLAVDQKDEDVLALEEALERLEKVSPRQAKMLELRFYGGLSFAEIAEAMNLSKRTVEREWTMVRAWLRRELSQDDAS
jgi:RNA polymerase sigma factor (TIGR02999 family)